MIKKTVFFLCALSICSCGFGKRKDFPEVTKVIELTQLDSELINEIARGDHSDYVVECKEGTTIPVQFIQHTPLFGVSLDPNLKVFVQKNCYIRVTDRKSVYVSFDMSSWERASHLLYGIPKIDIKFNQENTSVLVESTLVEDPDADDDDDDDDWDEDDWVFDW